MSKREIQSKKMMKKMKNNYKNIILIGPPRSGKTTLAKRIIKELDSYSLIGEDSFITAFIETLKLNYDSEMLKKNLPEHGCYYYYEQSIIYESSLNYVVDLSSYDEELFRKYAETGALLVFLTYPKLTEEDLFKKIRKNDKSLDWTYIESDKNLRIYCDYFIKTSKQMENYAKENNFICIDISKNRDKVLDNTFNMIKEKVGK